MMIYDVCYVMSYIILCYVITRDTWARACTYFSLIVYPVLSSYASCLYLFQSIYKKACANLTTGAGEIVT